jgi:GDPmannose 4,6-dehydratase
MPSDLDLIVFDEERATSSFHRTAFITGITGQDGSYLAELLLSKGYTVHGLVRQTSTMARCNLDPIRHGELGAHLHLHYGDVTDFGRLLALLVQIKPHEVYHLASQSHVRVSFEQPDVTQEVVAKGALNVFRAVRQAEQSFGRQIRVFNASSSEMFGSSPPPQSERTPFHPRSPYGVAKVAAHWHAINHRESYGMFIANGVMFNHESPRRGEQFVSRKISRAVGRIVAGSQSALFLGNLEARRDWGFAGDYVEAMWMMLQHHTAEDFVVATGQQHSVKDMLDIAFSYVGLAWQEYVRHDLNQTRPAEIESICGDPSKASKQLEWTHRCAFVSMMQMMVENDVRLAQFEAAASGNYPQRALPDF